MKLVIWTLIGLGLSILVILLWATFGKHRITIAVSRTIQASPETVFHAVSDIESFPRIQPEVLSVEFLTESRSGLGTRFLETRQHGEKEMVTELEVTEFVDNEKVRMVTDSHGTIWDTVFLIRPEGARTDLEIRMDARPHEPVSKITTRLFAGMFRSGMESYADLLKDHCESAPEIDRADS